MNKVWFLLSFTLLISCKKDTITSQETLENSRYIMERFDIDKLPAFKDPTITKDVKKALERNYAIYYITFEKNNVVEIEGELGVYKLLNNGTLLTIFMNNINHNFKVIKLSKEEMTLSYQADDTSMNPSTFTIIYYFKKG